MKIQIQTQIHIQKTQQNQPFVNDILFKYLSIFCVPKDVRTYHIFFGNKDSTITININVNVLDAYFFEKDDNDVVQHHIKEESFSIKSHTHSLQMLCHVLLLSGLRTEYFSVLFSLFVDDEEVE